MSSSRKVYISLVIKVFYSALFIMFVVYSFYGQIIRSGGRRINGFAASEASCK